MTNTPTGLIQVLNSSPTDRFAPRRTAPIHSAIVCALLLIIGTVAAAEEEPFPTDGVQVINTRVSYIDYSTFASSRLGIIREMHVREGDLVSPGQSLMQLDDRVAEAQYNTAAVEAQNTVEIRFAAASADVARAEYESNLQANLRVPGAVPQIEVERLKLAYVRSLLQIQQARHQKKVNELKSVEAAQMKDTYLVAAKFQGVITKLFKKVGEGVREGDPILTVSDPTRVKVSGFVHTRDVHRIKPGDPVKVKIDIPDFDIPDEELVFEGKLTFIDDTVDATTFDKIGVSAEVENIFEDGKPILRQGYIARMIILTDVPPAKLKAPPKAAMLDRQHIPVFE